MTDLIKTDDHTTGRKVTAEEVENNCPATLQDLAKRIAVCLDKARRSEEKAKQYYTTIAQHLAEAQRICDDVGFKAFREKFFPDLGKSRVYELLQIATNKKSIEQTKASTRERVAKHRAKNATLSVTVTEKSGSAGDAEDATTLTAPINPKDEALMYFSTRVTDLIQKVTKQKPDRFAATSVSPDDLARLGKFLSDLADLKRLRTKLSETDAANDVAADMSTPATVSNADALPKTPGVGQDAPAHDKDMAAHFLAGLDPNAGRPIESPSAVKHGGLT